MRQSGHLGATLACLAGLLLTSELMAQPPTPTSPSRMGQSELNVNAQGVRRPTVQTARSGVVRQNQPVTGPSYIAVMGAVKTPTVFESAEPAVLLKTLIERAGGETQESIGTVRIMERTQTRFMTTLNNHLDLAVTHGQVVFVVPRGGRPARVMNPRQSPPDRFVLISGLARGPLLFNIGNQSQTLGDLLLLLGQSPEMVTRQQVQATQPQGQWMDLDSLLVHNTIIDFNPEGVNTDGVRAAVDKGFRYELPVNLAAIPAVGPGVKGTARDVPAGSTNAPPSPKVQSPLPRARVAPPETTDLNTAHSPSGIERAGSSIPFDEPLPFPARSKGETDANARSIDPSPDEQPHGRTPLMLPKAWQNPNHEEAEGDIVDPARAIERTSAGHASGAGDIITVSAETETLNPPEPTLASTGPAAPPHANAPEPTIEVKASSFPGPQSWLALLATVGVAVTSVVVSRIVSREDASTLQRTGATSDSVTPDSHAPTQEDEQRYLQRLILNKVPLIEEEAVLPPVDRLHGMSIGGRRLIVHDAHEGVAGPHFKVRDPNDSRAIELQLRRLMRSGSSSNKPAPMLVTTAQVTKAHSSRVSPLERALRNVEQEDT